MSDKVTVETPESSVPNELVDSKSPGVAEATVTTEVKEEVVLSERAQLEEQVTKERNTFPDDPKVEAPPELKPEAKKDNVQKRIDKVIAQKKSAEEELAEARAEIERLKQVKPEEVKKEESKAPPTIDQIEAYIVQVEERLDNTDLSSAERSQLRKEKVAATRYLIQREKEDAITSLKAEQEAQQSSIQKKNESLLKEWVELANDYADRTDDGKLVETSDFNLNNKDSLLYRQAMEFYKAGKDSRYKNESSVQGFRKAVIDAYNDITRSPKPTQGDEVSAGAELRKRAQLANPSSEVSDDAPLPKNLSDTDVVTQEITRRQKLQQDRAAKFN